MTDEIPEVLAFIQTQLRARCEPVLPKKETSQQKHLTVWQTREKRRPIGLESGHGDRVNLWLVRNQAPPSLPPSVEVTRKVWKDSGWKDEVPTGKRDGANSNLKPFELFNTRPIVRLGVKSVADARLILDHVLD